MRRRNHRRQRDFRLQGIQVESLLVLLVSAPGQITNLAKLQFQMKCLPSAMNLESLEVCICRSTSCSTFMLRLRSYCSNCYDATGSRPYIVETVNDACHETARSIVLYRNKNAPCPLRTVLLILYVCALLRYRATERRTLLSWNGCRNSRLGHTHISPGKSPRNSLGPLCVSG